MVLAVKLFFLAVRQLSKPIANRAKDAARSSDAVKAVAVSLGQGVHRLTTQVGRLSEGKATLVRISPLSEAAALDKGAETLGELLIYSVAGVTVAYEYNLQQKDKRRKELKELEAEVARLEAADLNEKRQWAEFSELRSRMTLMEEQLWALRQAKEKAEAAAAASAAAAEPKRRSWMGWGS